MAIVRAGDKTTETLSLTQELSSITSNQGYIINDLEEILAHLEFHLKGFEGDDMEDDELKDFDEKPCLKTIAKEVKDNNQRVNSLVGAIKTLVKDNI